MSLPPFEYISPETIEEAAGLLSKFGKQAELLAGGTDLILDMRNKKKAPKYIIDLKSIRGLEYIEFDEDGLRMGSLTTVIAIRKSEAIKNRFPALFEAATEFASWQVQNRATVGGNLCRSSPAGDLITPLLVFDAQVGLIGTGGKRDVALEKFFSGPGRNIMNIDEILTEVKIPRQEENSSSAFRKMVRSAEDIAKINCAVKVVMTDKRCDDVRVALGAVGPVPLRAKKAEAFIRNKEVNSRVVEETARKAVEDISPITDIRSTLEYREVISKILVRDMISLAIARASKLRRETK
jgi:carbon-monoxide dehydrogenase medium subunit